jgi:hypothetical protein
MTTKRLFNRAVMALGLLGFGLVPSMSRADIAFYGTYGSFNTALPSGVSTDNVLFNSGLTTSGTHVQGETKSGLILDYYSTQNLQVNSGTGGQAKIDPGTGVTTYDNLKIVPASTPPPNTGALSALSFNIQTVNSTDTFLITVTANEPGGGTMPIPHTYTASSGNQEVGIIATNGESISSVTISSLTGAIKGIDNTGEYRIAPGNRRAGAVRPLHGPDRDRPGVPGRVPIASAPDQGVGHLNPTNPGSTGARNLGVRAPVVVSRISSDRHEAAPSSRAGSDAVGCCSTFSAGRIP